MERDYDVETDLYLTSLKAFRGFRKILFNKLSESVQVDSLPVKFTHENQESLRRFSKKLPRCLKRLKLSYFLRLS